MMFVPMEPPAIDLPMEDLLYGINITFPNGTLVSVKKGCAKSVMALMKLYEKEDAYNLRNTSSIRLSDSCKCCCISN